MDWLRTLLSWWASFSNTMAEWAYRSETWLWPLNIIAPFFRALSSITDGLFTAFFDFVYWADRVERDIRAMVTQSWVVSYISSALTLLNQVWPWFSNWWGNVTSVVTNWWSGVSTTVLGWVDTAKTYALSLFNNLQGVFNTLQARWDNFWATVLPTLATRLDVDTMVKSTLTAWFPFYNDLVQLWSEIKAFFADPLQWVYNKLDSFFERFW